MAARSSRFSSPGSPWSAWQSFRATPAQLFRQLMVIRDDHGEAEAFRQRDFRVIRDPAVHGDQEGRFRGDLPDGAFVQSVAVRLAAGKPEGDLRAFLR